MAEYSTPDPIQAIVEIVAGDAVVRASARTTASVDVAPVRPGRRADEEAAAGTTVSFADGRLEVRTPKQRAFGLAGRTGAVVVTVELPAGSDLEATTQFGDVITSGTLGRVRALTKAGSVRVDDGATVDLASSAGDVEAGSVRGEGVLATTAGGIRVEHVSGSVRLTCSTGEVSVGRVAGSATIRCPYGSVRVREAVSGSLDITSSYSDVTIGIAEGTAAKLDVSTNHGRLRNELDRASSPPEASARLEVTARTNYGSVTIRRA